jgi:S1-C subfamily serine protease
MGVTDPEIPTRPDAPSGQRPGRVASAAKPVAALVAASLLGGSAALGGAWALGAFDDPAPVAEVAAPIPTDVASTSTGPTSIDVAQIYRRSAPGVVQITSTSRGAPSTDIFGDPIPGETQRALGSGFVIDKEGHVVTNYHVVQGATSVEVSFSNQ